MGRDEGIAIGLTLGADVGADDGEEDGTALGGKEGDAEGYEVGLAVGAGVYDTWKSNESVMDASSSQDSVNVYELICASPGVITWYSPSLSSVNVSMTLPVYGRTTDATTLVHALGSPRYSQSV